MSHETIRLLLMCGVIVGAVMKGVGIIWLMRSRRRADGQGAGK
jgi:hypothetical protein